MKRNPTIPNSDFPRCTHTSPSGRRCRSLCSSAESPYCLRHKPKEDPAAALVRDLQEFRSVADVTVFLSRLISALSRDQISTRRAAVLSDVAISLMNALRSLQKEYETNQRVDGFEILPWTWSMPRRGSHGFDDTDDARAFFAQQYADKVRAKVEKQWPKGASPPATIPIALMSVLITTTMNTRLHPASRFNSPVSRIAHDVFHPQLSVNPTKRLA